MLSAAPQVQSLAEQLARLEAKLGGLSKVVVGALTPAQQHVLAQLQRDFGGAASASSASAQHLHTPRRHPARASMPPVHQSEPGGGQPGQHGGAKPPTPPLQRGLGRASQQGGSSAAWPGPGPGPGLLGAAAQGNLRALLHSASMAGSYSRQQSGLVEQGQAQPRGQQQGRQAAGRRRRHSDSELCRSSSV
jgi:hypothetical protein